MSLNHIKHELFEIESLVNFHLGESLSYEPAYSIAFLIYHRLKDAREQLGFVIGESK